MNRLKIMLVALFIAVCIQNVALAQQSTRVEFPNAEPESVGMSTAALHALDDAVKSYIEHEDAVGAELMIIKNRKTVWHTVHGLRDNQTKAPMEKDGIFCVRSMTKPVVGTAIQMLIDEGRIGLDDPASKYLPAFDNDEHRAITIRNLLEHRSGLPLSSLLSVDHKSLKDVQDVAALAGKAKLEFPPGSDFNYSDDGADTLTAIVATVTGKPIQEFIADRIIGPLGMNDTMCVLKKDDARTARVNSLHVGSRGAWTRFWAQGDDPLFPYFLGSQSLYSTCADYARFICLWSDGGVVGGKRLLSEDAIQRGLTPRSDMAYPTMLNGLKVKYGQLWMLWVPADQPESKPVVFGHGGSDGTAAWMWPDRDLIVLYFTQSRGGTTVLTIESAIDQFLIRGDLSKPATAANVEGLAGVYWHEKDERYWAVWPAEGKLRVEIEGRTVTELIPADEVDTWKFEMSPSVFVKFARDDRNAASEITIGGREGGALTLRRLKPSDDLPSVDSVVEKVVAAHHLNRLHGVIRRSGILNMPAACGESSYSAFLGDNRVRADIQPRGVKVRVLVSPDDVWIRRGDAKPEQLTGQLAEQTRIEQPHVIFGDWRNVTKDVTVLKRLQKDGQRRLLVRMVPREAYPCAFVVEEESGRVLEQHRVSLTPGLGAIGVITTYDQFEDIGGALLPKLVSAEYATPLLGKMEVRIEKQEVIEPSDDVFSMDAPE